MRRIKSLTIPTSLVAIALMLLFALLSFERFHAVAVADAHIDLEKCIRTFAELLSQKGEGFRIENGEILVGSYVINGNFEVPDKVQKLFSGTATVFMGDVRVSTNVLRQDGRRAVGTRLEGAAYDAIFKQGKAFRGETLILGLPYLTAYDPIRDSNGKVIGALYVGMKKTDFLAHYSGLKTQLVLILFGFLAVFSILLILFSTLMKKAAKEKSADHKFLLDIIQFYPDATMVIDSRGTVTAWNQAMEELSGVRAEEMLGKGDYEYALPFYGKRRSILIDLAMLPADEVEKNYVQIERRGNVLIGEAYIHNALGKVLYFHGTATALRNSKGEIIGAIESIRDLTERKRMEERASYLASFPELTPNPVLEVDSSGKVTFFNPATQSILETLGIGSEDFTVFLPADLHEILGDLNKKKELTFHREIRVKDRVFFEEIYLAPQFFDGARLFVRDITEQKLNEEELCFKNIILSTQQECTIDGILVVDDSAAIISYNRRFVDMWGIPSEIVEAGLDAPLLQFNTNQSLDPEGFLARVRYLYEHREVKSREEIALKDGRVFDRYSAPMTGSEGKYYGRVWYFRDITERNQMEEELRKAKGVAEEYAQRLEFVLEGSNDATWEWDILADQGVINTKYYEMTGYSPEEVVLNFAFFVKTIHPDDASEVQRCMQEHLEGKTGEFEAQYRMVSKSGTLKNVLMRGKIVRYDEDGRPIKMAGVVSDITEHKRLSDELNRIHNFESIGLLAGGLAHDFNNMMNIIYGNISFAKMLAKGDTAVAEPLTDAEEACERAKELGIRLQALSQGSSPVKEPVALPAIIEDAAGALFEGSNISHTMFAADGILPVVVDSRQIRQVFENLLTNAKEAMTAGGTVTIDIGNYLVDGNTGLPLAPGKYVCVTVQDDGKGIPEEHLPKIFDPYFSTKDTYSQKGMGLGLTICHAILKKHQGHILVESKVGVGTRVALYLPASAAETTCIPEG